MSSDKVLSCVVNSADEIGISDATFRNWRRLGVLRGDCNKKLCSRANKRQSQRKFKPEEYIDNAALFYEIDFWVNYVTENNIGISEALFLVVSNISGLGSNPVFQREIELWSREVGNISRQHIDWFREHSLNIFNGDVLGLFYQLLLTEGQKAVMGSYYTPSLIVRDIVKEYATVRSKILDPACGTGQFLIEAARVTGDPNLLYGFDSDPIAVRLCRINLICKFPNRIFEPNIYCVDMLSDCSADELCEKANRIETKIPANYFDLVITNPPWGGHIDLSMKNILAKRFPQIMSGETFSYFLVQASKFAKCGGYVSFLLPEAILNIKIHDDIRKFLCKNTQIVNIINLGRIFSGVFTSVIRLDYCNKQPNEKQNEKRNEKQNVKQNEKQNVKQVFAIHQTGDDRCILDKIDLLPKATLKNHAKFALGIVTGNNEKHILSLCECGSEPIFRGRDVEPFILKPSKEYIIFVPERFQQVASENLYRAEEKLIYRFISRDIVFAYDNKRRLTLNSANILIPDIPDYPIKALAAVLNSEVMRFIYRKRFNTIKVLRGNLENLPIPILSNHEKNELAAMADKFIETRSMNLITGINQIIFNHYNLNDREIKQIVGAGATLFTQR
ncbi:MAG: N-6 DNA methylase [Planctomycetaceae bacterium]|jgi:predicted RNA methylase|nr:N-6 DNA methylase [Planctomycetaceae bacterium]